MERRKEGVSSKMNKTEEIFCSLVKAVEEFNTKCLYYKNKNMKNDIFSNKGERKNTINNNNVDEKKEFYGFFSDFVRKINQLHQNFVECEYSTSKSKNGIEKRDYNVDNIFVAEKKKDVEQIHNLSKNKNYDSSSIEKKECIKIEEELDKKEACTDGVNYEACAEFGETGCGHVITNVSIDSANINHVRNKNPMNDGVLEFAEIAEVEAGKKNKKDKESGQETPNELNNGMFIGKEQKIKELYKSISAPMGYSCVSNNVIENHSSEYLEDDLNSDETDSCSTYEYESNSDSSTNEIEADVELKRLKSCILIKYVKKLEYGIPVRRISREELIEDIKNFYIIHNSKIKLNEFSKYLHKNVLNELNKIIKKGDNLNNTGSTSAFQNKKNFFDIPSNYLFVRNYDSTYKDYMSLYNNSAYEYNSNEANMYMHSNNSSNFQELSNLGNISMLMRNSSACNINSPKFGVESFQEEHKAMRLVENKKEDNNECILNGNIQGDGRNESYEAFNREESHLLARLPSPNFGSIKINKSQIGANQNCGGEMNFSERWNMVSLPSDKNKCAAYSHYNASSEFNSDNEPVDIERKLNAYNTTITSKDAQGSFTLDNTTFGNFNNSTNEMMISNQLLNSGDELANSFCGNRSIHKERNMHYIYSDSYMMLEKKEKCCNAYNHAAVYGSKETFPNLGSNDQFVGSENSKNFIIKNKMNSNISDFCKIICDFYKNKENGINSGETSMIYTKSNSNSFITQQTDIDEENRNCLKEQNENINNAVNLNCDDELASIKKTHATKKTLNDRNNLPVSDVANISSSYNEFTEREKEQELKRDITNIYEQDENNWLYQYCKGDYNLYRSKQLARRKEIVLEHINKWNNKIQKKEEEEKKEEEAEKREEKEKVLSEKNIKEKEKQTGLLANAAGTHIDNMRPCFNIGNGIGDSSVYNTLNLKIIYEINRSAFELNEPFHLFIGQIIINKYKVEKILSQTHFSTTVKCLNLHYKKERAVNSKKNKMQKKDYKYLCLKIMKRGKSYFDQGLCELTMLNVLQKHRMEYRNGRHLNYDTKNHTKNAFSNEEYAVYAAGCNNVIELYDCFYYREHLVIVTEYMQSDLYSYFIRKGKIGTLGQLQILAKKLLQGIAFIHSANLIHCDLKPENIMINMKSKKRIRKNRGPERGTINSTQKIDRQNRHSSSNIKQQTEYLPSKNEIVDNNMSTAKRFLECNDGKYTIENCTTPVSPSILQENPKIGSFPNSNTTNHSVDLYGSQKQLQKGNITRAYIDSNSEKGKCNSVFFNMNTNTNMNGVNSNMCKSNSTLNMYSTHHDSSNVMNARYQNVFSKKKFDKIKIIDFNSAIYETDRLEMYVQTRTYRSPEVLLQENYDRKIDIWSLGCILFEFITKKILFDYINIQRFLYSIASYIGTFPFYMIRCSKLPYIFTKHGFLVLEKIVFNEKDNAYYNKEICESDDDVIFNSNDFFRLNEPNSTTESLHKEEIRKKIKTENENTKEVLYGVCYLKENNLKTNFPINDTLFIDFLLSLLQIDPTKRPNAIDALKHPWMRPGLYEDGL